jgi:carbamoyl-phosphate synthase small subunit
MTALLVLEDGRIFRGEAYGARGEGLGEAVFTTGMTGYQETLTDPSYHRQIVVQTAPQIGNTGWNDEDDESRGIQVAGYAVRDPARTPSNWRSRGSLEDALRDQGVVGIAGIDTRALVRHLRERGAMRAGVFSGDALAGDNDLVARVLASPRMEGADLYGAVTTREPYVVPADGERRFRVAALDVGIKSNTPRMMAARGIEVYVLPAHTAIAQIEELAPDGFFVANGPGDPATADAPVELTREVLQRRIPTGAAPTSCATATAASTSPWSSTPPAACRSRRRTTGSPSRARRGSGSTPRSGPPRSPTPARTTAASRACAPFPCRRSACSTTPRPPRARTTPRTCSTGSSS